MKNKELSELLGIEPRYKIKSGSRVFYFALKDKAKAEKQLNWLNYVNQNIDDYLLYPDFEKPENFVRLISIFWKNGVDLNFNVFNIDNDLINFRSVPYPEYALTEIIQFFNRFENKDIKQQAQQTEWVY